MIDAPTIEIAIGRNSIALAIFSNRERSTITAYTSPTAVEIVGVSTTQKSVLRRTLTSWSLVTSDL
jgi:hypothetical protein